jgi:hypothetical protein
MNRIVKKLKDNFRIFFNIIKVELGFIEFILSQFYLFKSPQIWIKVLIGFFFKCKCKYVKDYL